MEPHADCNFVRTVISFRPVTFKSPFYNAFAGCVPQILKSFASEVQSDSREIAANAVERSPEIGGFAVGVVENDG